MLRSKKIFKFTSLILGSFLFIACAGNYDLEPSYDKSKKVLEIDDLKLKNAVLEFNKVVETDKFEMLTQRYVFKNEECTNLSYNEIVAKGSSSIDTDLEDSLITKFLNNGKCDVIQVGNLKFYECINNSRLFEKKYFVGSSESNKKSFSTVLKVTLDEKCHTSLLKHFKSKAKKDEIKIKNYNLKDISE